MGVVSNSWFDSVLLSIHVRALMLTDVQTLFLGTPLVPLRARVTVAAALAGTGGVGVTLTATVMATPQRL